VTARDALPDRTLAEVAGLIRNRSVSPVELVASQLARICALDDALNAFALVTEDVALAQARAAEAEILAGGYRGPLHGVPVAVKDVFATGGVPTQGGLRFRSGHVPDHDAVAVGQLRHAGAILVGKLQTAEGAMDGYHRDIAIPRNPWGADRWPGVSSSGPGVAVAAGMCFAALATDTGGSIRIPSAANGIVGLKPTHGVVSVEGVLPLAASFDHVGPMARSVGDAAILLQALAGLEAPPRGITGVRIGVDERLCHDGVQPCVTRAVGEAMRVLEKRGASIVPASLPAPDAVSRIWYTIVAAEAARAHRETFPSRGSDYGEGFRALLERGRLVSATAYEEAQRQRAEWTARAAQCFGAFDVLATPALPGEAFVYDPEDAYCGAQPAAGHIDGIPRAYLVAMNRLMLPFNLNGYPTLALPCGASPAGLPLGLQLVGRPLSEPLLIACGLAFEQDTAWHLRRPPIEEQKVEPHAC
jgi:amidase